MSGTTFKEIFEGNQDIFEEKVDVTQKLLSKLEASNLITKDHRNDIEVNYVAMLISLYAECCALIAEMHCLFMVHYPSIIIIIITPIIFKCRQV